MASIKSKVSIHVREQLPEFIQSDHPDFVSFLKTYYEFLETAVVSLNNFGSIDSILYEEGDGNYIIYEDTNRYRTGVNNKITLEIGSTGSSIGAFENGEIIIGSTSKATATVKIEDISNNSRLFITSQNKFIMGETIIGQSSNATASILNYTANPIENVMQMLDYADTDQTIETFFNQFKESFMKTIPKTLSEGSNERNLLKNIKDLYRAKGNKQGHKLFFRMLLNEEIDLEYPTKYLMRASDGKWTEDTILRVKQNNSTLLMEDPDPNSHSDDIFILAEDGSQVELETYVGGSPLNHDLTKLVGQTITQDSVYDISVSGIGNTYYNIGYPIIEKATAVVDSVFQYTYPTGTVYELILNKNSVLGSFYSGQQIYGINNEDTNQILEGKIVSIVSGIDRDNLQSSQYFKSSDNVTIVNPGITTVNDPVGIQGLGARSTISKLTQGRVEKIIVNDGGKDYLIGDKISVDNTETLGSSLEAKVSTVNGGILFEDGTLTGNFRTELENNTPGQPGKIIMEHSTMSYTNDTGHFQLGDKITGRTSSATGIVTRMFRDISTIEYIPTSGSFMAGEVIEWEYGERIGLETDTIDIGMRGSLELEEQTTVDGGLIDLETSVGFVIFTAEIQTNTPAIYETSEEDIEATSTDRIGYEEKTQLGDIYSGNDIIQEVGSGIGDITDVIVTNIGYGYQCLPKLSVDSETGSGATLFAKGINVGKISNIEMLDQGVDYYEADYGTGLVFDTFTNFLCKNITNKFYYQETITGTTSGATMTFKDQDINVGVIKCVDLSLTPFIEGEEITGSVSGTTAIIDSFEKTKIKGLVGTNINQPGKYVNNYSHIGENAIKIQDSYYWQDYSYVVRNIQTSIVEWRNSLLSTIHPSGWKVFGEINIETKLQTLSSIRSAWQLGPFLSVFFPALIGRRLGTSDQGLVNPSPTVEAGNPKFGSQILMNLKVSNSSDKFKIGSTITGSVSGATAIVLTDTTYDEETRLLQYHPVLGIFNVLDVISGTSTLDTPINATVLEIYGLRGKRDVTLNHDMDIVWSQNVAEGSNFNSNYNTFEQFKFANSMQSSGQSAHTFRGHNVYPVLLPLSTLNGNINDVDTSIVVVDASDFPSTGTIQIGDELIDYLSITLNTLDCTGGRGAHGTSAIAHTTGDNTNSVRWATKQKEVVGFRIQDWLEDYKGTAITIGDITNYPYRKNNISPPTEVTIFKT